MTTNKTSGLQSELEVLVPIDPLLIKSEDEEDDFREIVPLEYEPSPDPLEEGFNNCYNTNNVECDEYFEPLPTISEKKTNSKENTKKPKKKRKKKDKEAKVKKEESKLEIVIKPDPETQQEENKPCPNEPSCNIPLNPPIKTENNTSVPYYNTTDKPQLTLPNQTQLPLLNNILPTLRKPQYDPQNTLMPHLKPQINLPVDRLHVTNTLTRYRSRTHLPQNAQTYVTSNNVSKSSQSSNPVTSDSCDSDGEARRLELKNWRLKEEGGYVTIDFGPESGETLDEMKKRLKREKDRKYRASLTAEKVQANREACNKRYRERKMLETPEEQERRRLIRNELAALRRERIKLTETPEEREERRKKYREKNRMNRMKLNEEQKARRRAANTRRMQNLSEEQMIRRKESLARSNEKQRQKRKEMKLQKLLAAKGLSALTAMDMHDSSSSNCY